MTAALTGLPSPRDLEGVSAPSIFVVPRGLVRGDLVKPLVDRGQAFPLCGRAAAFSTVEIVIRHPDRIVRCVSSVTAFDPWRHVVNQTLKERFAEVLEALASERQPFAGLAMDRPQIMGIVNVTPDSFSDGGDYALPDEAIAHGLKLAEQGADVLDVGGESTRPGAAPVAPSEEQMRVIPVVKALAEKGCVVSIDTRHASTMAAAIEAGASIVNDVTALQGDSESLTVVAREQVPVILMHMQGEPQTMQSSPEYAYAPIDVYDDLSARVLACVEAGIHPGSICVDPGIGFGKDDSHNVSLLNNLGLFHGLNCPVMLGASRKSFIGRLSGEGDPKKRVAGSISAALTGVGQGVQFLRVHDVAETRQALDIAQASGA